MALWILSEKDIENSFTCINHNSHLLPYLKRKRIPIEMFHFSDFERLLSDPEAVLYIPDNVELKHTDIIKKCNLHQIPVICIDSSLLQGMKDFYFSSISDNDQQTISTLVAYCEQHGRDRIAFFGANLFFVDMCKIRTLYSLKDNFTAEDAYLIYTHLDECFDSFFENREKYDAVVCANDIFSLYFIKRMEEKDPDYVQRTFIISFMNTVLSQVAHRSLTTISYDRTLLHSAIYNMYRTINKNRDDYNSVSITLNAKIFTRQSTFSLPYTPCAPIISSTNKKAPIALPGEKRSNSSEGGPLIEHLLSIEQMLQTSDIIDLKIIYSFLLKCSNDETAAKLFISLPTIKYRSGELFKMTGVKNKRAFLELIEQFVDKEKLKEYIENYETGE